VHDVTEAHRPAMRYLIAKMIAATAIALTLIAGRRFFCLVRRPRASFLDRFVAGALTSAQHSREPRRASYLIPRRLSNRRRSGSGARSLRGLRVFCVSMVARPSARRAT
jgi:hypothetical protein